MPTNRTRLSRSRVSGAGGLTAGQLEHLISGFSFFEGGFKDETERRRAWLKHKDFILSLQGKPVQGEAFGLSQGVYFDFFTRPQAWWVYDSPGQRLFISCKNDFCPNFSQCPVTKNISTAAPDCLIRKDEDRTGGSFDGLYRLECVSHDFKIFLPQRETETTFLQRHSLLNEAEKQHIEMTESDE